MVPKTKPKVIVSGNGPYLVSGNLPMMDEFITVDRNGFALGWKKGKSYPQKENYALCRCGHSTNKPYCTGAHAEKGFNGRETASRKKYLDQAGKITGPELVLTDARPLCSSAGFCGRDKGTWKLTEESDNRRSKKLAIQQACNCPSGRLVVWDKKTGKAIEPKHKPSVSIVEDPGAGASGPIWLKGGIPVESANGAKYEVRNRVNLCRCGKSMNKPFCDGRHLPD